MEFVELFITVIFCISLFVVVSGVMLGVCKALEWLFRRIRRKVVRYSAFSNSGLNHTQKIR